MFSYIDRSVKQELLRAGKLLALDERGALCDGNSKNSNPFLNMVGPVPLPISLPSGEAVFRWYCFVRHTDLSRIEGVVDRVRDEGPKEIFALLTDHMSVNSLLLWGDFETTARPLVRVHSNCLTGDVFGSMRCDCGPQLLSALEQIRQEGAGALVYMAGHEGRGIGLWAKAITYLLQDAGHDTYQANEKLGLPADSRDFSDAGRVLAFFRQANKNVRLIGNNPMKRDALLAAGFDVAQEPLVVGVNAYNVRYLGSKREHGHHIPGVALDGIKPAGSR